MSFCNRLGLTDEDKILAEMLERFSQEKLAPMAAVLDRDNLSAACHLPALAELGLTGMNIPEQFGGVALKPASIILAISIIAQGCAATASMLGAHFLGTDALLLGGSDAQREQFLTPLAQGQGLAAFALTEPGCGSNPAELTTHAIHEDGFYRMVGAKQFISNAEEARTLIVFAKTDKNLGHKGISAFIVPRDTAGLVVDRAENLMGIRGGKAYALTLDCRVPASNLLGHEGDGFKLAMKVLDNSRLDVAATCLGIAQAALVCTTAWVKERMVGGKPLNMRQGVQWTLADMGCQLEAAWGLTLQAAHLRACQQPFTMAASMAKLFASEMVSFVTDRALQLHGGYGYTQELPLERFVRDARIMRIYEGSSEIQRTVIGRLLTS